MSVLSRGQCSDMSVLSRGQCSDMNVLSRGQRSDMNVLSRGQRTHEHTHISNGVGGSLLCSRQHRLHIFCRLLRALLASRVKIGRPAPFVQPHLELCPCQHVPVDLHIQRVHLCCGKDACAEGSILGKASACNAHAGLAASAVALAQHRANAVLHAHV